MSYSYDATLLFRTTPSCPHGRSAWIMLRCDPIADKKVSKFFVVDGTILLQRAQNVQIWLKIGRYADNTMSITLFWRCFTNPGSTLANRPPLKVDYMWRWFQFTCNLKLKRWFMGLTMSSQRCWSNFHFRVFFQCWFKVLKVVSDIGSNFNDFVGRNFAR